MLQAGSAKPPSAPESSSSYGDLEEIAKKERQRIEELIKKKGQPKGFYPRFTVAVKGQKVINLIFCDLQHFYSSLFLNRSPLYLKLCIVFIFILYFNIGQATFIFIHIFEFVMAS